MTGEMYFGTPGGLISIPHPRNGVQNTRDRPTGIFRTGDGGARVGRALSGARSFKLTWDRLWYETFADIEAYHHGHNGPGPFVLHDPSRTNWLTINQSGATSHRNDTEGFTSIESATFESSALLTRRGPRAFRWNPPLLPANPAGFSLDSAASEWPGIPVITGQAVVFSFYAQGDGTDDDMTVTPEIAWLDEDGVELSDTSGTPVAVSDAGWSLCFVTGTPPANCVYLLPRVLVTNHGTSETLAGLYLPGVSGNYASTPDTGVLDITGDIRLMIDVTLADWTPAAAVSFVAKYTTGTPDRSYWLRLETSGFLTMQWSTDGASAAAISTTITPTPNAAGRLAVRVLFDVDNGAGGKTATFETAPTSAGPWTQLEQRIEAGTTSIFSGAGILEVGSAAGGTGVLLNGVVHAAEVQNAATATVVANPRFDQQPSGTTSFADAAGRTWTINTSGSPAAQIVASSILFVDEFQLERGATASEWRPGTGVLPVQVISLDEAWPWQAADYREHPVLVLQEMGA